MRGGLTARIGPYRLALAVGTAWWAWVLLGLRPAPPTGGAAPAGRPGVSYMPVRSFTPPERPDARAIWSPVLFSLPTPAGFSREVPSGPAARPPLDPAPEPPPLLARRMAAMDGEGISVPGVPLPAPRASTAPSRPPPRVAALVPVDGALPAGARFPLPPGEAGSAPWEAEVRVAFDAAGVPTHVFVESEDAPTAVRAGIFRGVMGWRRPGEPAGWVVARLVHPGAAEAVP